MDPSSRSGDGLGRLLCVLSLVNEHCSLSDV